MFIWIEIKKYLLAYKRVLFWLASAGLTSALLIAGVRAALARENFFEPFSVGVVDNGGSPEIRYVFDYFDEVIALEYLEKPEAEAKLAEGTIPAYVELPESFARDIITGRNSPFTLYGNRDYPLRLSLSKLLAKSGVAFLSSAQAGIYATLDYAAAHGLPGETIDARVLLPINVAFVKKLLAHEEFFDSRTVQATGTSDPGAYYGWTFAAFMFMAGLLSFLPTLRGYGKAVYARYRLAGQSFFKIQFIRLAGLFAVEALIAAPVFTVAAAWLNASPALALAKGLSLALCVSAFGLAAAALFRGKAAACGVFIFLIALTMLFFSGGTVPLAFLPRETHVLRYLTVPYWAAGETFSACGALSGFAVIFFGVACVFEFFSVRFSRAV
ncbi:MAG: ABC transporter permease [Clostridiales bacterium]|jgi:hypothetical protein|nr:ABC transporter permease [Clostridiales bacterium]